MRYLLSLYFLFNVSLALKSQGFRVRHYLPNELTSLSQAMFESTPGNYIGAGLVVETLNNVTCNRLCVVGMDAQGQITWTKKYGNSKFQYLTNNFIIRSYYKKGNHIYFAGCALDSNNTYAGVLIKFDFNGDTLWQKTYRDPDPLEDVIPQMVTASVDGGFLITGYFQNNSSSPYSKCMLIKTDGNGNELWRKKIAKVVPNMQDGKAIAQDPATGKIVIVGYQYIGSANAWGNYENVLILDSQGTKLSQHTYVWPGLGGVLEDLIQTQDGKFVAAGIAIYPQTLGGYNLNKSYIVKFDVNSPSTPIWIVNNFDRLSLTNAFHCIKELPNGDILAGGILDTQQVNNMVTNSFVRLTKFSPTGTKIWNRNYDYKVNAPESDNILAVRSLELTSDGSWIAAIEVFNFPSPNPYFFVKFDSTGCDSTLAYCQAPTQTVTGVYQNKLHDVEVEVFPNPASTYVNINVNGNSTGADFTLQLTDVSGRELKQQLLRPEDNRIDFRDLSNGVYLLRLSSNNRLVYTSRVVKKE